jgi:hypothetical protein
VRPPYYQRPRLAKAEALELLAGRQPPYALFIGCNRGHGKVVYRRDDGEYAALVVQGQEV